MHELRVGTGIGDNLSNEFKTICLFKAEMSSGVFFLWRQLKQAGNSA